jgi:endogenous inhibitor of DNA gyrase (YacG/DUF329 family)
MTEDRLQLAQDAVDEVLSPAQQAAERMADGTYRVRCMTCGKSVSNPLPIAVIVRAWVECPECLESAARVSGLPVRPPWACRVVD